jgi:hydrogenase maturation protein HypF
MQTYHIHIAGLVQGVGFRPYVYRMAQQHGLNGEVYNSIDGVHIIFNATEAEGKAFYHAVISESPAASCITSSTFREVAGCTFHEFGIIESISKGEYNVLLTPDFSMCNECRNELNNEVDINRRKGYPFITCINCGPRYSIIHRLPYDRENTSMESFTMCPSCKQEYNEPTDRRYYSQTNSCADCGISLVMNSNEEKLQEKDYAGIIQNAVQLLEQGKIIAVKGIGGYLLICDAANRESIRRLRNYKQRPSKPFALMYPDVEMLKDDVLLNEVEEKALTSSASPVLLLQLKEKTSSGICFSEIAPGLNQVGVMLPYAPVYELLLSVYNKPVIATSANISSSPIVFEDEEAVEQLNTMADFIISNNRKIVVPQDDSVIKFSLIESQEIVIRRSRGLAPTYINPDLAIPSENILATGALLKSTVTLTHQQNVYISQYLGDLDNYDVQKNYEHCLNHFYSLFETKPEIILADKHPDYFSTSFGVDLAKEINIPIIHYQHHEAHFAAVLGENNLLSNDKPVLGIIWDGIGLGHDGNIWGGEFFIYHNYQFQRHSHIGYFDYLLGDKMAREPRIAALAATAGLKDAEALIKKKFSETEWFNYQKLLQKKGNLKTSSVGRLFDAVASLLDLSDISSYEGEAAMYLEDLALSHFQKNGLAMSETYFNDEINTQEIFLSDMLTELTADIRKEKDKGFIAAKFHYSLAHLVKTMSLKLNIQHIALSGGVFQNAVLVDLIKKQISPDQSLFLHRQLSPNDECISFGQLCCYIIEEQKIKNSSTKNKAYVFSHSG